MILTTEREVFDRALVSAARKLREHELARERACRKWARAYLAEARAASCNPHFDDDLRAGAVARNLSMAKFYRDLAGDLYCQRAAA